MQKKIQIKYIEIRPIYNILKKYIGTNDINLTCYANFEQFSDHEFPIEKIKELIGKHFDVDIADDVVKVLWLNANVNYKRNYNKVEEAYEHWETEYCTDDIDWDNIEKEVLELYLLINKNKSNSAQPISIKIGKVKKITLKNTLGWFTHFLNNHCFAKIDPPINSVENALKRLKEHNNSSVGAKVKDKIKNAMKLLIVPLAKLKSMCEKYDLKATKNAKYSIYETLFNELIENVDVRLVVFAPKESVLRRDYPFTKFPNELKNEMLKHVEKLEIQKQFMKLYGKFFEKTEDLSL